MILKDGCERISDEKVNRSDEVIGGVLVVGDRNGSIHLFNLGQNDIGKSLAFNFIRQHCRYD